MRKFIFAAGVAVGYVLGAKAGRDRYETITRVGRSVRDNPVVQNLTDVAKHQATRLAETCRDRLKRTSVGERLMGDARVDQFPPSDAQRHEHWETAGINPSRNGNGTGYRSTQGF